MGCGGGRLKQVQSTGKSILHTPEDSDKWTDVELAAGPSAQRGTRDAMAVV